MRCAVSFLAILIISIGVGVIALYIIWIAEREGLNRTLPKKNICPGSLFMCADGLKCIKPHNVCDKVIDCSDSSDEKPSHCNDLITTKEALRAMTGCKEEPLSQQNSNSTLVNQKPERCSYSKFLNMTNTMAINCGGTSESIPWSQVPWHEFGEDTRSVFIHDMALNTTHLKESDLLTRLMPREFPVLSRLYIERNHIESLSFCQLKILCWFSLRGNGIRKLTFCPMKKLIVLKLSENKLTLDGFQFADMDSLKVLSLDYNEITEIRNDTFVQLNNLMMLNISHNKINVIHEDAFRNNTYLIDLDLSANQLTTLPTSVFQSLTNLKKLYISSNPRLFLSSAPFQYLISLRSLNIETFDISQIDLKIFDYTKDLDIVYFKKFGYCKNVPKAHRCYPNSDGLSSTTNLLIGQSRIAVWLVGLLTIIGNISVLIGRWCKKQTSSRCEITDILNIFLTNLAIADCLMGVYLLILAWKDVEFRGNYNLKAYNWSKSWLCSGIGIIAMISSEVSLLILTIMSLERYLTIGLVSTHRRRLNKNLARASMLIIWAFACTIALAPAFYGFYGSTGLCFPIHLDDQFPVGWQYTTFIFIGVNSCCLALITISYSMLFYTVRKTRGKTPVLSDHIALASRFFLMVITDVACWLPLILLKAIVLCGHELSKEIIGWVVIYVLPLNSAVNPILYTFSTNDVRKRMTTQFERLMENFELNQLLPSQNHANILELQGMARSWLNRLVSRNSANSNDQRENPAVTATTDTEVTQSTCPTIMTIDGTITGASEGRNCSLTNSLPNQNSLLVSQNNATNGNNHTNDNSSKLSPSSVVTLFSKCRR